MKNSPRNTTSSCLKTLSAWNELICYFLELCIYDYTDVVPGVASEIQAEDSLVYTDAVPKKKRGQIHFKKHQNFIADKDEPVGTVMIGTDYQPICVPDNSAITVLRKTLKVNNKKVIYLRDSCSHHLVQPMSNKK